MESTVAVAVEHLSLVCIVMWYAYVAIALDGRAVLSSCYHIVGCFSRPRISLWAYRTLYKRREQENEDFRHDVTSTSTTLTFEALKPSR